MTSDFSTKITKLKTALENVFVKKADIKDNLTSTDTDKPLSAYQGKLLNDGKADTNHTQATSTVTESSALGRIGTSANASQHDINLAINTLINTGGGSGGDSLLGVSDYYLDTTTDEIVLEYSSGKLISTITKSTSGLVDTYTITYTDNSTYQFTVTNGQDGSNGGVDIVTNTNGWNSTTSDSKVPSEKLVKNSLDAKLDATHSSYKGKNVVTNSSTGAIEFEDKYSHPTELSSALTTLSLYKIKANTKGHITEATSIGIDTTNGGTQESFDLITSHAVWKGLLDKADSNHTHYFDVSDLSDNYNLIPTDISDLSDNNSMLDVPTDISDLTDRNDILVDLAYQSDIPDISNIPSDVSDLTDTYDTAFTPKSHTHTKSEITDFPTLSAVATSGSYNDLSNKPSIPSASTDLSDTASLVRTSNTSGLIKNDGSIDTSTYLTTGTASSTYVAKETGKGLFSGSYSDLTNKPSYTATITSSNTGAYEIGSTNINGSNVSIYGVDKQGKIIGTNETLYTAIDTGYRYRIWLETSGGKLMPVNTSSSTSATANKSSYMNTRDFYLNGRIFYCNVNGTTNANATFDANTCYQQVDLTLGFSFNNTGSALSLTVNEPVYMIAEDRGNGMGRLTSPYFTQTLPSSADNKLYIYLGHSISETTIELSLNHPIYEYKGSSIRLFREYYTSSEIDSLIGSAITLINGNGGNS